MVAHKPGYSAALGSMQAIDKKSVILKANKIEINKMLNIKERIMNKQKVKNK